MAKVIDQHLGATRGKVGPNLFRMRGNKSFVGPAPKPYKKTKEAGAINNRRKFSMLVDFASAVNSNKTLKSLWKESEFPGKSAYTKIISLNYTLSGDNFMKLKARIVPYDFDFAVQNVVLEKSVFDITFTILKHMSEMLSPPLSFIGMIVLTHPKELSSKKPKANRKIVIIEQKVDKYPFDLSGNTFSFKCPDNALRIVNDYDKAVVYFAVASSVTAEKQEGFGADGYITKGAEIHEKELIENERIKDLINDKKAAKTESETEFSIKIR
jgi:hypothetical protein